LVILLIAALIVRRRKWRFIKYYINN
jgi:hypothetical protein